MSALQQRKIWSITIAIYVVVAMLWTQIMFDTDTHSSAASIPIILFGLMVAVTEFDWLAFKLSAKNQNMVYSFMEINIILGVLFVDPNLLIPVVAISVYLVSKIQRGAPAIKCAFNSANVSMFYAVSWVILHQFNVDYLSPTGWLVVGLAVLVGSLLENLFLESVLSIVGNRKPSLVTFKSRFMSVAATTQGLIVALVISIEPMSVFLFFMAGSIFWLGFKAYSDEHLQRSSAEERATTDYLTGISNRLAFDRRLDELFDNESPCAVAYIDMDGFKAINDTHGHDMGDMLLIEVSDRLRKSVREQDLAVRMGGDEFAVVFETNEIVPESLVSRITESLNAPITIDGVLLKSGASVGFAVLQEGETKKDFLHRADQAMYEVKELRHEQTEAVLNHEVS